MKELFLKFKKPVMLVGIFIAVFTVYTLFIKKEPVNDLAIIKPEQSVSVQDNRELLAQLQALNAISLNTQIFESSIFKGMQDNTIIIENRKPEGRRNPFLPIGVDDGNFAADQSIVGATNNTNGLLNQTQGTTTASIQISKNVQNIKPATTTLAVPKIATTTKTTN
jgi:hypothetical protein